MFTSLSTKVGRKITIPLKSLSALCVLALFISNQLTAQVFNGSATISKKISSTGVLSNGLNGITSGIGATPGVRGWFYFNISSIPQGSTITSAVLNYPTANGTQNSTSQANQLNALSFDPQSLSGTALYSALVNGAPNVSNLFTGRWSGSHPLSLNTNGPNGGNGTTATTLRNHIQARVNIGFNFLAFSLVRGSNNQYNFQTPSLTINYTPPPPCVNPPTAGTTVINPSFACPSTLRTLSLNGATFGVGQTYQWQSSPDNIAWSNITGATTSQYQTGIATNSYYRCIVTCGSGSSTSASSQATVDNYLTCYCSTSYPNGCSSGDEINNVTIAGTTLNNSSGCSPGSYIFYNAAAHTLLKTTAYSLSVTLGGDALGQYAAAWIDFDQSGSFETVELVGAQATSVGPNGTAVFNFTVPSTAINGQTRLRIRGGDDGPIGPDESCDNTSNAWGETEDYLINIATPAPCNDPPVAGTITGPDSTCSGTSFQLLSTGFSSGTTLQWQSSANAGGPFSDVAGETSAVLSVAGATSDAYYRLKVSCLTDAFTLVKAVTIKSSVNCLCPATYTDDCQLNDEITNVTLGTLNNSSGCSPNAYFFYNNVTVPDLAKSISYNLSVSMSSDPFQFAGAWIDYNKNSIFESTEFIGGNTTNAGANGTAVINFTIPTGAILGITAIRIRGGHDVIVASSEGCGLAFSSFGETEDYIVNIVPQPPCIDPPVAGSISGTLSVCNGETTTLTLSGNSSNTTLQWQESTDGINYNDIAGATSPVLITSALTSNTFYQVAVTCVNSSVTVPVQVSLKSFIDCYCTSDLNNTPCGNGYISDVTIATTTLSNPSGCSQQPPSGAYSGFPAGGSTTATLLRNVFYNLTVQTHGMMGANVSVWIDFNQNGVFESSEWTEVYLNNTSGTVPVFIQPSALLGQTGMRVRSILNGTTLSGSDACTTLNSGETEDYIITIDNAPLCSDPPVAGTISGNSVICSGTNVSLNLNGYTLGTQIQWQSSPDNVTWNDISGATSPFLNSVQLTSSTYFRAYVTCVATDTSAPMQVTIKPFYECYCNVDLNPLGCGNGDINNVQIAATTLNNTSTCNFILPQGTYSSFPAAGSSTATLQQGTPYNLAVAIDPLNSAVSTSAWIDYNRNGVFEAAEWMQIFSNGLSGNITFTVPVNAGIGLTGMRIRSRNVGDSNGPEDACERFTSGETEDYLVSVTTPGVCTDPPAAGSISGNLNICSGNSTQLSLTGFTPGTSLQWQTSPDGTNWTNIPGANNNIFNTGTISGQTHYRVEVTCVSVVLSNPVIVNVVSCFNMQNGSVTACSGNFYDDGGDVQNYSDNQNLVYTITPTAGNLLEVQFNSFELENGADFLKIYNGNNTSASQVGPLSGYTGNVNPGTITSSAIDGSLTFEFISDGINNFNGWYATLNCLANICSGAPVSGSIIQPSLNCIGQAASLTLSGASAGSGISYQWQESDDDGVTDPYVSISGATLSTYNTPVLTASKWYKVTVLCSNSGLSSVSASYEVQFKPSPEIIITSNAPACEGSAVNFFAVNIAAGQSSGNTFSWGGPAGFSSSLNNPAIGNVSSVNIGYYVVSVTNQFQCSVNDSIFVDVKANPSLVEVSHTDGSCNLSNDGFVDVDAIGGEAPYLYNDGSNFNLDGIFSSLPAGTILVSVEDANGCPASINVVITEPPPVSVSNAGADQSLCENDAVLSANAPLVGTGSWSFITGTGTIANPLDPQTAVTNLQSGSNILRWTIKFNACPDSSYDDVEINAGAVPTATIYEDVDICIGNSAQIKIDFTGNAPWTYSYTDGTDAFGPFTTSNPQTIITVAPAVSTSYVLLNVISDNCPGNVSGLASVTVSNAPPSSQTAFLNGLPPYGCVGTSAVISCAAVANATSYEWDAPLGSYFDGNPSNTSPYTTSNTSTQITFGPPNGSGYLVCARAANGCGAALQRCVWVRGITGVPAAVTGPAVACENTTQAFSTGSTVGATGYTWSGTNGISITSGNGTQNITASFAPGFTQGNVCVSSNTTCYLSPPKCLTIKNSVPQLPLITGPNGVCPNPSPYFYSINPVAGIASYQWTLPLATSGSSSSNAIGVTFNTGFSSGNICVKGTSICGVPTATRCFSVLTGVPPTPSAVIGPTTALCGQTVVYTSAPVQGALSYNWTVPAASQLNSGQGTNSIGVSYNTASLITGEICVSVNSSCPGNSTPRCITIKGAPNNPGVIVANPTVICPMQEGVEFTVPVAAGNYLLSWIVPNDAAIPIGQGTNSITVDFGVQTGNVIATASNPCGSASSTYYVDLSCSLRKDHETTIDSKEAELFIHPNPSSGKFYLAAGETEFNNVRMVITDAVGKIISDLKIQSIASGSNREIDLSGYPPGFYFLKMKSDSGIIERKLVLVD